MGATGALSFKVKATAIEACGAPVRAPTESGTLDDPHR